MVWDGRHHLCAVHVVNDMQCVVFDCCDVCCVDDIYICFWTCCFEVFTASCGASSIFVSQMAVGFSNAIRIDVSFEVFIINTRNPVFHPFVLLQAMCSGSVLFTWLKCGNHVALLLQCNHCLEMFPPPPPPPPLFFFFFFFLVSQALTTMLAKRGTVLCVDVLGTTLTVC